MANDDVVAQLDAKKLSCLADTSGKRRVGRAWGRISARVVVHEHDGMGCDHDGDAKDFARMRHGLIERANGHQVVSFDPQPCAEHEHHHTFHIRVVIRRSGDVVVPVFHGFRRQSINIRDSGEGHSRRLITFNSCGADFLRRRAGGLEGFGRYNSSCFNVILLAVRLQMQVASRFYSRALEAGRLQLKRVARAWPCSRFRVLSVFGREQHCGYRAIPFRDDPKTDAVLSAVCRKEPASVL